ncbi:MAG: helix-turn-helix transcriptional regulator [Cyclobacteriaceae bacterium]
MSNKNWLTELREELHWTQKDLAVYLGLDRTLIAHVEKGQRTLSSTAHLKVMALRLSVDEFTKSSTPAKLAPEALAKLNQSTKAYIEKETKRIEAAMHQAKQQLAQVQGKFAKAQEALHAVERMRRVNLEHQEKSLDMITDQVELRNLKLLNQNGPKEQLRLRAKISGLEATLSRLV